MIGITSDSALIVASLNSFFGAAGLGFIYFIQRRSFRTNIVSSIIQTTLVAFSFGYWFYSGSIKTNIIPVFLTICVLTVLLKHKLSKRDIIVLSILNGLAIVFHEAFILTAFSTLLILALTKKKLPNRRIYSLGMYATLLSLFVISAFGIVIVLHENLQSFSDGIIWVTRDSPKPGIWNSLSIATLEKALVGFLHSIFGIYFCFKFLFFQNLLSLVPGRHDVASGLYLVRNLPTSIAFILFCFDLIVGLFCITIFVLSFSSLKNLFVSERELLLPPLMLLLVFGLFFLFWDPSNMEFWVVQSVMFWLIFGRIVKASNTPRIFRAVFPILPVLIFLVNYFGNMYFLHSEGNDHYRVQATAIASLTNTGDIIISDESSQQRAYYKRHAMRYLIEPDDLGTSGEDSVATAMTTKIQKGLLSHKKLFISFNPFRPEEKNPVQQRFQSVWNLSLGGASIMIDSITIQGSKFFIIMRND